MFCHDKIPNFDFVDLIKQCHLVSTANFNEYSYWCAKKDLVSLLQKNTFASDASFIKQYLAYLEVQFCSTFSSSVVRKATMRTGSILLLAACLAFVVSVVECEDANKRCKYFQWVRACKLSCKVLGHTTGQFNFPFITLTLQPTVNIRNLGRLDLRSEPIFTNTPAGLKK